MEADVLTPILDASAVPGSFAPGFSTEALVLRAGYGDVDAAFPAAHAIVVLDLAIGRQPQKLRLGIPRRRDPAEHSALSDAAAEPGLHRGDAWQALGGARRSAEGIGDRGQGSAGTEAVVEAARVADWQC